MSLSKSLSQALTATSLAFALTLLSGSAGTQTHAQTRNPSENTPATLLVTQFTGVYHNYLAATNQEETNGLRRVTVPDFAIYDDYLGKSLRGEEAFVYAAKIYDGTKNNLRHDMRFHLAKVTDQYAITYAEESITTVIDVKEWLTPEQRAKVSTTASKSTVTWRWKHTWRKTPLGWKLASLSRDNRSKAERSANSSRVYYVGTKPSHATAADKPESANP